jgi:hypothetical protein
MSAMVDGALVALGQIGSALAGNWLYALIGLAIVFGAWREATR